MSFTEQTEVLKYDLLLDHDLQLRNSDYQQLSENVIEVKKKLVAFLCKLKAEG